MAATTSSESEFMRMLKQYPESAGARSDFMYDTPGSSDTLAFERAPGTIAVTIKLLKGEEYVIFCREEDSVLELKRQVALSSGVAVDRQRLIFKGKALHDGDALMSLKITDGTKIHLTFRTPAVVAEQEPVDQDMAPAPERPASADIEMEHTTTEHFWLALEAFLCAYLTDTDAVRVVADFKQQYGNRLKHATADELRTIRQNNSGR